jgi:hypothetical protein
MARPPVSSLPSQTFCKHPLSSRSAFASTLKMGVSCHAVPDITCAHRWCSATGLIYKTAMSRHVRKKRSVGTQRTPAESCLTYGGFHPFRLPRGSAF